MRGISAAVAARALDGLTPLPVVVERDRGQAEAVLSIDDYVRRRLTPTTVRRAREMAARHKAMLEKVSQAYGVQPRYLVAVWGIESNFGRFTGVRPTVQALATLAFDGRRGTLFRNELFDALRIVERGHASLDDLKGSWAGAMGQPQFMPSSYLRYAEDFDGDGERDIWNSHADVFASIANYLKAYGWDGDATWGRPVRLPAPVTEIVERAGSRGEGCRAERALTPPPVAGRVAGDGRAHGQRRQPAQSGPGGVAAGGRPHQLSRLRQLRGDPRLQLRQRLRAQRRDARRSPAVMFPSPVRQFHQGSMPSSSSNSRPAAWMVAATAIGAVAAMAAAVYFAGQDLTPIALVGTTLFVLLGGFAFELARRRSSR